MEVLRAPGSAFDNLPGYAHRPHFVDLGGPGGPRMHYVDEGAHEHPAVLLLHGVPTWSFLYRRVIPIVVEAGCRAVAPDLIGCGRSDRPADPRAHRYAGHVEWLAALIVALELHDITLVCEDLGAIFGLRLVADLPERFARVVALNPCLPGPGDALPPALARWAALAHRPASECPTASSLVRELAASPLSAPEAAGYDAPFVDGSGPATLAGLGALLEDPAALAASEDVLARLGTYRGPLALVSSESDPRSRAAAGRLAGLPTARAVGGAVVAAGRRAIVEDRGPELAGEILALIRGT